MPNVKTAISQNEVLFNTLQEMQQDITSEDRTAAVTKLALSKSTISTYLTTKVHDNDTAVKLIKFFKKRIADRFEAIK